jgi:uncharacterized protein YjbJ (UPF0337 family)
MTHGTPVALVTVCSDDPRPTNSSQGAAMNWDRIEGNWKQITGKVKQQWGKLTDDDIDVIAGKRDELVGKIQEQYGIKKDEAERQVDSWGSAFRDDDFPNYQ